MLMTTQQKKYTSEKEYLKGYDIKDYDSFLVTVDVSIFTLVDNELHVLLVKRGDYPQKGKWALPGGFIQQGKDKNLHDAALRKLLEKTGVKTFHLEQVSTFGDAKRDPRGWSISTLYMGLIPHVPTAETSDSIEEAKWWPYEEALRKKMAYDHKKLMQEARERLKAKSGYTVLPMYLLKAPFTLTQLQQAFEELMDTTIEKKSFRRRIQAADLLEEVGEGLPEGGRGRMAALFKPKKGSCRHAFVRRFGSEE